MNSYQALELIFGQLWQVTILCVAASWASKTFLAKSPALSYQLWLVVLLKCLTPPLWASECGVFSWCFHQVTDVSVVLCDRIFGSSISLDTLITGIIAIWLGGFILSIGVTAKRWKRLQKRIRVASIHPTARLTTRIATLAKRLGIKRPIELVLTTEPIGPAVIGTWRPMLVLPADLAHGKDVDALEPILAHELLHIRRGDTLVAILETVVRALWWFHPAVQRAADSTSQAGELCCDGDVLGELMYQPRRYADSLLDVLESKCKLQPMVATPGIRRDQVTRERLRRIMVAKPAKPRALLRVGLLLLALMLFLPGRAISGEEAESTAKSIQPRISALKWHQPRTD